MESSFQMEPVQECEGHVEVKTESDFLSFSCQPDEHVDVKSEDVMSDCSLKGGIWCIIQHLAPSDLTYTNVVHYIRTIKETHILYLGST